MNCSLVELQLTLWGKNAETFNPTGNPVVAIKGCKVSDYSGVSLGALSSSLVQVNPDIQKCHELKGTKFNTLGYLRNGGGVILKW